jgi:ferrous iron transport protein A
MKPDSTIPAPQALNLSRARCGEKLRIISLHCDTQACQRLRELGFCEQSEIHKVADRGTMICCLLGTRVAIGRDLGRHILVEPVR